VSDGDGSVLAALRRLVDATVAERFVISVAALLLAIFVGFVLIVGSGALALALDKCSEVAFAAGPLLQSCYDPIAVYAELFVGAVENESKIGFTLKETTILLFAGLSVAVAFRAGMFNIGSQGQLVFGALGTALAVLFAVQYLPSGVLGTTLLIPIGIGVGAVVGGLYGAIPGALKAYADANEVITTIMLNFVATKVAFVLTAEIFQDPESQVVQTRSIPNYAVFPNVPVIGFEPRTDFSLIALAFGLALVGGLYYLLTRTSYGYDLRTSGIQPAAAEYGGVDAERTMVSSMALSGAIAGVGGAVWVLMIVGRFQTGVPAYGFDGITVSILAGNNPIGTVFAALLFGGLKSGSLSVSLTTGVPQQLVGVLRGLIILFVAMPEFFRMVGARIVPERRRGAVATDGGESE